MTRIRFRSWIVVILGCLWIAAAPVSHVVQYLSAETRDKTTETAEPLFGNEEHQTSSDKESNNMLPGPGELTISGILLAWLLWNERKAKATEERLEKERRKTLRYIARLSKENNAILKEIKAKRQEENEKT